MGYYTLAVGAVALAEAPGRVRRNMPDPLPAMVLGRLAVDREYEAENRLHVQKALMEYLLLGRIQG